MTGDIDRKHRDENPRISLVLILKRNLVSPLESWTSESMVRALRSLHTVRLDREELGAIENLECVEVIESLYLQQNKIKTINNLDHLSNLRFLTLAGNQIRNLENLRTLRTLKFLDLSDNQIETLDAGELPANLTILNLTGNLCTSVKGYREMVLQALPDLQELDGEEITSLVNPELEEADDTEDSDYECSDEDLELESPLNASKGLLMAVHQEILRRSERRRRNAVQEHEARIEEALHLPSPLWALEQSHPTAGMDIQMNKEAAHLSGMKPENSNTPVASKKRPEMNATPKSSKHDTNPGTTKSANKRDNFVKASLSPTAAKFSVSQIAGNNSPAPGKTTSSSSPAARRVLSSPPAGKTSQSPAQTKVPLATTLRKSTPSPISGNVPASPVSRKSSPTVSGKAVQSPVKKVTPCPAQEKVPLTFIKGQKPPSTALSSTKGKSSSTPTRLQTTKPIPVQTVSRGPK